MDFRNALKVIKHHLAVFLVVTGMFAGVTGTVGAWLWKEYRDLQQQIAQFEQRKSEVAEVQNNRELELKNREYIAGQIESNYTERAKALKGRELELQRASEQLKLDQQALIAEHGEKAAEMKLQALMSEFSALGVNLNSNPFCGDKEEQARYYSAKAKYDEIYSWAEAHSLQKKYRNFLFHNQRSMISFGCAKGEKGAFAPSA
jgi:F0F1-type ATP synthase membrane subunit b/b'